jgi:uncharacterized protein (DUF1501 family)
MKNDHTEQDAKMDGRREVALGLLAAAGMMASRSASAQQSSKRLVVCFQRFAADGLMELIPYGDSLWATLRGADGRPTKVVNGNTVDDVQSIGDAYWALHPDLGKPAAGSSGSLYSDLWLNSELALIPGSVIPGDDTRSHFTAQARLETAGAVNADIGFCSRALYTSATVGDQILRGVCLSDYVPDLARGEYDFLSIPRPEAYRLTSRHPNIHSPILSMYQGQTGALQTAGKTAEAIGDVRTKVAGVTPQATFGNDEMNQGFRKAAQFIIAGVGTQIITLDVGGWDMHTDVVSQMAYKMPILNSALVNFKKALNNADTTGALWRDTTVVFVTEFGRTVRANSGTPANGAKAGTDHGLGSLMIVAGGSVKGRRIYGNWPANGLAAGLALNQYQQELNAVPALNDYRHALAEIFEKGLGISGPSPIPGVSSMEYIFPGFTPAHWGIL